MARAAGRWGGVDLDAVTNALVGSIYTKYVMDASGLGGTGREHGVEGDRGEGWGQEVSFVREDVREFPEQDGPLMIVTRSFKVTSMDAVPNSSGSCRYVMIAKDAEAWEVWRARPHPSGRTWEVGDEVEIPLFTAASGFARPDWDRAGCDLAVPNPFIPLIRLAHETEHPADLIEVIGVFETLFSYSRPEMLPGRAVIVPYIDDACYVNLKDNTPPWEEVEPDEDGVVRNFSEIFLKEIWAIDEGDPARVRDKISRSMPWRQLARSDWLPERMRMYEDWIAADLLRLLEKRLVLGRSDSLLEDVFKTYSAGYFPCGWTGSFPKGVRLLVFPGT